MFAQIKNHNEELKRSIVEQVKLMYRDTSYLARWEWDVYRVYVLQNDELVISTEWRML